MTIYQYRTSLVAVAGTVSGTTLNVRGGLGRQLIVRANTATTLFRVNLVDANSVTVQNYAFHEGELVDNELTLPMAGTYTVNVTNANPVNDTFQVLLAVEE